MSAVRSHAVVWREMQRRWLVAGVLGATALAVLTPRLGAVGGVLRAEVSACVPLAYVHYAAGRRADARTLCAAVRRGARVHAICMAHAHLVGPALSAALVTSLRDGVHPALVQGMMLWSRGGGCAWLSLALSTRIETVTATALVSGATLLTAPLVSMLLCGSASLPVRSELCALAAAAAPFAAGVCRASCVGTAPRDTGVSALRVCALALFYCECCERLDETAGVFYTSHVLLALLLECGAVCATAGACELYVRCGVLSPRDAHLVLVVAVPRAAAAPHCAPVGLARLPAVFLAPAQALLLAALTPAGHEDTDLNLAH